MKLKPRNWMINRNRLRQAMQTSRAKLRYEY